MVKVQRLFAKTNLKIPVCLCDAFTFRIACRNAQLPIFEIEKSEVVGGMNHVIVVTERIVLFIVCYADKMCSKERWA